MNVEEANPVLAVVQAGGRLRDALRHSGYDRTVTIEAFHPAAVWLS